MKKLFFFIIPILISCQDIDIIRTDEKRITEKPNQIDSNYFKFLKDTFHLDSISVTDKLTGSLKPKYSLAFGIKDFTRDSCLFYEGCMFPSGISLIIKDSTNFYLINNIETLKKTFAPIENEEEALSYAFISSGLKPAYDFKIKRRYRKFVDKINTTYSIKKDNGYEVNLFDYILCGCGPHSHYMVKIFVNTNGDIQEIDRIKLFEDPKEDFLCID